MSTDTFKVNFNTDWQYYYPDKIQTFEEINRLEKCSWLPILLPHVTEDFHAKQCWYRKQFNWDTLSKNDNEQVYLEFDSTNINISIWINNINIEFNKKIELTNHLIENTNTLILCCQDQSLSLHVNLLIAKSTKKIDCKVQLDDDHGRFDISFDGSRLSLSSMTSIQSDDFIDNRNKLNDDNTTVPRLTIVILTVGTRGDVQPFIALGKALVAYGHRVRLATHEPFRQFVRENDLEFYPLAGDPSELMLFMVKNAGIIPSFSSIVSGDISKHRQILAEILESTWSACTAADDETGRPFTAEAIIANPPSFGHIHCAEKLQIPVHIIFTMPWSPTAAFPHPLCNIDSSKESAEKKNYYSYQAIEMLTWSGMRTIINHFRRHILGLSPLHTHEAINLLVDQRVPHTYCWSTALAAKPADWGAHIDVSGFFFLNLSSNYTNPPEDLVRFLNIDNQQDKPIYIGFGSITGHDCQRILHVVIDALKQTGYRAVLSGFANESDSLPENIFKIGNVPHDWLFQYVSAVCHHGGAGTTAAGLRAGKPTIIVPFFGDQFFWGNIIERSGAGPRPLPGKTITADELADAFRVAHQPSTRMAAEKIQSIMEKENGCEAAVRSFHSHLPLDRMRSDLDPTYAACYRIEELNLQISEQVAHVLFSANLIQTSQLKHHCTRNWKFNYNRYISPLSHISFSSSPSIDEDDETELKHDQKSFQELFSFNSHLNIAHLKLTKHSLWHSKKLDAIRFLKRLRTHDDSHSSATNSDTMKALILAGDCAIQPTIGTFPGTTWLGHQTFDTVEKIVLDIRSETSSLSSTTSNNEQQPSIVDPTAKIASLISGLPLEATEKILSEFEKIQNKRKQSTSVIE